MIDDRLSRPATGARTPRALVLLGVVVVSLVGCSADGRSGTDSVVAMEEARAEAAAEVAEAQAAIDRQVEAADAQKAEARAAAEQAAAAEAAKRAAADRAAAEKAAAQKAAAQKPAAQRAAAQKPAARKPAAQKAVRAVAPPREAAAHAAKTSARPPQRTPASGKKATPGGTVAKKVLTPAVPRPRPVATRPARAAAVPKPASPGSQPAVTKPAAQPQSTVSATNDLHVVVAPGGTVSAPGHESVAAGCEPQDFLAGDAVRLTTASGATVHETVLPACQREVVSAPGTGVAITSPRFFVTLPEIAWRHDDAWVLQIGTRQWPVTASTLSAYGWSIAVSAEAGVTAGPMAPVAGTHSS